MPFDNPFTYIILFEFAAFMITLMGVSVWTWLPDHHRPTATIESISARRPQPAQSVDRLAA